MDTFNSFNTTGRINEIQEKFTNSRTGFTKQVFTITGGSGKSINFECHHQNTRFLEGLKREDLVHVEFTIKGSTLKTGQRINNLVVQKVTRI